MPSFTYDDPYLRKVNSNERYGIFVRRLVDNQLELPGELISDMEIVDGTNLVVLVKKFDESISLIEQLELEPEFISTLTKSKKKQSRRKSK